MAGRWGKSGQIASQVAESKHGVGLQPDPHTPPFLDVASFFKYTPGILSSSGDAKLGQRAPPGFQ